MQRFYGLHLWRDLGGPRLRYGRLLRLIRQLPEGCATWRSAFGDSGRWTLEHHLLATIADDIAMSSWSGKGRRPKLIPRPGVSDKVQRVGDASQMTQTEVRALLRARGPQPDEEVPSGR